jgi:ankyrin repeat protein
VEYLVSLGADVNAQFYVNEPDIDDKGEVRGVFTSPTPPPLHFAVIQDSPSIDVLKYLVSQGAGINATLEDSGLTPLLCAAMYSFRVPILECLISLGADVHARDDCGNTPLHLAAQWSFDTAVLRYIISQSDMNAQNNDGMTPLDVANTEEKKSILREAMKKGYMR